MLNEVKHPAQQGLCGFFVRPWRTQNDIRPPHSARLHLVEVATIPLRALLAGHLARLHLLHHLIELRAQVLAETRAHLAGPGGHAAGVVLVHAGQQRLIVYVIQQGVLPSHDGKARDEPPQVRGATVSADSAHRHADAALEDAHPAAAGLTAELVDGHRVSPNADGPLEELYRGVSAPSTATAAPLRPPRSRPAGRQARVPRATTAPPPRRCAGLRAGPAVPGSR